MFNSVENSWVKIIDKINHRKRINRYKLHYKLHYNDKCQLSETSESSRYGYIIDDSELSGYESDARS